MYIVKDDQPDVPGSISPIVAQDAEGHDVDPGEVEEQFVTDDAGAVAILFDDPSSVRNWTLHFGAPGLANLNYTATRKSDGAILKSSGKQFTVTTGDIVAVTGGDISIPGLTES